MTGPSPYTRLARGRPPAIAFSRVFTLWQGPDHLLHARKEFIAENYRRLYFSDIQAITISRSLTGRVYNIILGAIILLCLGLSFYIAPDWLSRLQIGIVASLIPAALMFINMMLGPTCTCHVHTAVQREYLGALTRLPKARDVLEVVSAQLQQAQGSVEQEQVETLQNSEGAFVASAMDAEERTLEPGSPGAHWVFFLLLVACGMYSVVRLFWFSRPLLFADSLGSLTLILAGCFALRTQAHYLFHPRIRSITKLAMAFVAALFFVAANVGIVLVMIRMPGERFDVAAFDSSLPAQFFRVSGIVLYLTFGVLGVARLRRHGSSPELHSLSAAPAESLDSR